MNTYPSASSSSTTLNEIPGSGGGDPFDNHQAKAKQHHVIIQQQPIPMQQHPIQPNEQVLAPESPSCTDSCIASVRKFFRNPVLWIIIDVCIFVVSVTLGTIYLLQGQTTWGWVALIPAFIIALQVLWDIFVKVNEKCKGGRQ